MHLIEGLQLDMPTKCHNDLFCSIFGKKLQFISEQYPSQTENCAHESISTFVRVSWFSLHSILRMYACMRSDNTFARWLGRC